MQQMLREENDRVIRKQSLHTLGRITCWPFNHVTRLQFERNASRWGKRWFRSKSAQSAKAYTQHRRVYTRVYETRSHVNIRVYIYIHSPNLNFITLFTVKGTSPLPSILPFFSHINRAWFMNGPCVPSKDEVIASRIDKSIRVQSWFVRGWKKKIGK